MRFTSPVYVGSSTHFLDAGSVTNVRLKRVGQAKGRPAARSVRPNYAKRLCLGFNKMLIDCANCQESHPLQSRWSPKTLHCWRLQRSVTMHFPIRLVSSIFSWHG